MQLPILNKDALPNSQPLSRNAKWNQSYLSFKSLGLGKLFYMSFTVVWPVLYNWQSSLLSQLFVRSSATYHRLRMRGGRPLVVLVHWSPANPMDQVNQRHNFPSVISSLYWRKGQTQRCLETQNKISRFLFRYKIFSCDIKFFLGFAERSGYSNVILSADRQGGRILSYSRC